MSELKRPEAPSRLTRLKAAALAGIIAAGGVCNHLMPQVQALAENIQYGVKDALSPADEDGCRQIDYDVYRDTVIQLREGLRQPNSPKSEEEMDDIQGDLRVKHGLTAQNTTAIIQRMRYASTGSESMAILGEFTITRFGLETKTPGNADPQNFRDDAFLFANRLENMTNELIDAAGIDVVYLSDPKPASMKVDDGVAYAFTNATPGTNEKREIHIGPKQTNNLYHEIGHQIQRRYFEEKCNNRSLNNFPVFEAANPKDFTYQFPAKHWEGTTTSEYGGRRVKEDVPEVFETWLSPIAESCQRIEQSPVLINKVSIEVMMLNALKSGLGTYYMENFIAYCNSTPDPK